jgi:O-antigen/teichoic acid export membrane protein
LNLAELGVGASIAFFLYKPLYDQDKENITDLVSIMGYLYRIIGFVILGAGVIFSFFLPLIFKGTPFSLFVIYYCFFGALFSSLLGYFVNYRANSIFGADQRQYLVTGYYQATQLTQVILQAILAIRFNSFVLYITVSLIFSIINSIILNWKFKQVYPWVQTSIPKGKEALKKRPEIMRYVKNVFVHQIGGFVNSSVMPTVIYGFASLGVVTLYSNYTLVNSKVQALIGSAMGGSGASVGNLIAEGNAEHTYKCYTEMFSAKFWFVAVMTLTLYRLSSPFICVWLGKEYVISQLLVSLICADFGLNLLRETTEEFLNGYGLKADIWVPIARIATLAVMVITGALWGLEGILAVPVFFQLFILHTWKPYYLYRRGFKRPVWDYIKLLLQNILPVATSYLATILLTKAICPFSHNPDGWGQFLGNACIFFIPFSIISFALHYVMTDGMKLFAHRMFSYVSNLIRKH